MKKLLLTLVLSVFAFGSSGFISLENNGECENYAANAMDAEEELFGANYSVSDYYNGYYWY